MDKNAIKKIAVWARTELIARVSLKGVEYGITEDNIEDANADSVGGKVLTADEKKQRRALIAEINDKGAQLPHKIVRDKVAVHTARVDAHRVPVALRRAAEMAQDAQREIGRAHV